MSWAELLLFFAGVQWLGSIIQHLQCPSPKNFPKNIPINLEDFQNWDRSLNAYHLWTAIPQNAKDAVDLANWAAQNNYKLRPKGRSHSWSPLTASKDAKCTDTMLIRTDKFTKIQMFPNGTAASNIPLVLAESGATLEDVLNYLEPLNYTLSVHPEIGNISIGGVLAIGGHGLGLKAEGEAYSPGSTRGYVSNLIDSMEIVAWDESTKAYSLKTFDRSNKETSAFLTHLGHTFVTSVMLRVKPNVYMRCISSTDIKITELFAPPTTNLSINTFEKIHNSTEKATTFWFPFTEEAWVLTFSEVPTKPAESRLATEPYNYFGLKTPFGPEIRQLFLSIHNRASEFTPFVTNLFFWIIKTAMALTNSYDIWGTSKNLMLFVEPTAPYFEDMGYVVATKKGNMQLVTSLVTSKLISLIDDYKNKGLYPMNFPMQIRIAELDRGTDKNVPIYLSTINYNSDNPDFNIGMFFDFISAPNTYSSGAFFAEIEQFFLETFNNNSLGIARSEWAKTWAYTDKGPFTNVNVMKNEIPRRIGATWTRAICTFKKYDPNRIFTNKFLEELFVTNNTCNTV